MPSQSEKEGWAESPLGFAENLTLPSPTGDVRFGDVMAPFQRERFAKLAPDLLAIQKRAVPPIGKHWWEATKGASKDSDLAIAAVWLLTYCPRPIRGQVGAADKDQAAEMRMAATALLGCNQWLSERVEISKYLLRCPATEAEIEIVAADLSGSHGARPDFLIINELHAFNSDTKKGFAQNLMDNADKMPGVRVIATNAGFLNTWQWSWREIARTEPGWYFHKFDRPAPWISEKALAESRRRNTRTRYLRLWEGVWVPSTGDALSPEDVEASVKLDGPAGSKDGYIYAAGLDLGTRRDHSALVVCGSRPGSGIVEVASVESWKPAGGTVDLVAVRKACEEAAERYGLLGIWYDPSQAVLMSQELQAAGIPTWPVNFRGESLGVMASTLLQAFRDRSIRLYRDDDLLNDLGRLSIQERTWGYKLVAASDEAGHADRAIALAIVLPVMAEIADTEIVDNGPMPSRCAA